MTGAGVSAALIAAAMALAHIALDGIRERDKRAGKALDDKAYTITGVVSEMTEGLIKRRLPSLREAKKPSGKSAGWRLVKLFCFGAAVLSCAAEWCLAPASFLPHVILIATAGTGIFLKSLWLITLSGCCGAFFFAEGVLAGAWVSVIPGGAMAVLAVTMFVMVRKAGKEERR